jgi:hypothetical protein
MELKISTVADTTPTTTLTKTRVKEIQDSLENDNLTQETLRDVLAELSQTTTSPYHREEFERLRGFIGKAKRNEIVGLAIRTMDMLIPSGGRRSRRSRRRHSKRRKTIKKRARR